MNEGYFTKESYPFLIRTSLSSIIETKQNTGQIAPTPDYSLGDLLGFDPVVLYEKSWSNTTSRWYNIFW